MRLRTIPTILTCAASAVLLTMNLVGQAPQPQPPQGKGQQPQTQQPQQPQPKQGAPGQTKQGAGAQTLEQRFVQSTIESGYNEITLGMLAQERAQNDDVKDYAEMLVKDHGEINEDLTEIAEAKGLEVPEFHDESTTSKGVQKGKSAQTPAEQAAKAGKAVEGQAERAADPNLARLRSASGAEFDRQYIALMVENHERAVRDMENFARTTQDDDFKDFAEDTLDKLRDHLDQARELNQELSRGK